MARCIALANVDAVHFARITPSRSSKRIHPEPVLAQVNLRLAASTDPSFGLRCFT